MGFTGYMAVEQEAEEAVLEKCRSACGWPLKAASESRRFEPCSRPELAMPRVFDPEGFFLNG